MTTQSVSFMHDLESRYRQKSGLADRSQYKIFYGLVRPAPILALGINPGGDPANMLPDGVRHLDGPQVGAASSGFYENNECDLLDCSWRENNVLNLLLPLVSGSRDRIRNEVVKTNMAFRRSKHAPKTKVGQWMNEAAPFLAEIIKFVRPRLILLTGVKLEDFNARYAVNCEIQDRTLREDSINQTVFAAERVNLKSGYRSVAVQVAHASQFSWTYDKYNVPRHIQELLAPHSL